MTVASTAALPGPSWGPADSSLTVTVLSQPQ